MTFGPCVCVVGACFCGMGGSGCLWYLSLRFKDTKKNKYKMLYSKYPIFQSGICFIETTRSIGSIPLSSEY